MYAFEELYRRAEKAADPDVAVLLVMLMSELSEEHWAAGWCHGTEAALWAIACGRTLKWGMGEVSVELAEHLRRLAGRCGGWWVWKSSPEGWQEGDGETFVPLMEWIESYARDWLPRKEKEHDRGGIRREGGGSGPAGE